MTHPPTAHPPTHPPQDCSPATVTAFLNSFAASIGVEPSSLTANCSTTAVRRQRRMLLSSATGSGSASCPTPQIQVDVQLVVSQYASLATQTTAAQQTLGSLQGACTGDVSSSTLVTVTQTVSASAATGSQDSVSQQLCSNLTQLLALPSQQVGACVRGGGGGGEFGGPKSLGGGGKPYMTATLKSPS